MAHDTRAGTGNRLIDEKSPYLLQHAQNPVDWYVRPFLPNKVLLRAAGDASSELCNVAPFTADQKSSPDGPTIYVCQDFHCHRPTRDVKQALRLLDPRA